MLRYLAYFFSIIFHPLLVLTYMLIILLLVNPYMFGVNSIASSTPLILMIFLSTFFIPVVAVVMMKFLGLISSFEMRDRHERIGPNKPIAEMCYAEFLRFYTVVYKECDENEIVILITLRH